MYVWKGVGIVHNVLYVIDLPITLLTGISVQQNLFCSILFYEKDIVNQVRKKAITMNTADDLKRH